METTKEEKQRGGGDDAKRSAARHARRAPAAYDSEAAHVTRQRAARLIQRHLGRRRPTLTLTLTLT